MEGNEPGSPTRRPVATSGQSGALPLATTTTVTLTPVDNATCSAEFPTQPEPDRPVFPAGGKCYVAVSLTVTANGVT